MGPYEPIFVIFFCCHGPLLGPLKGFSHLKRPQVRFEKSAISTRPGYFSSEFLTMVIWRRRCPWHKLRDGDAPLVSCGKMSRNGICALAMEGRTFIELARPRKKSQHRSKQVRVPREPRAMCWLFSRPLYSART